MSVIRAFIALDLSPRIYERLENVSEELKQNLSGVSIRWVPVRNIHLTLKFLGDVSVSNLAMLEDLLQGEAHERAPFDISVGELGAFPTNRRPRIIWVGVQAPQDLIDLQRCIENAASRLGYAREQRSFSPHLTLGRVSRNAGSSDMNRIGDLLQKYKLGFVGAARINEVHLYRSDLKPTGAVYTRLASAELQG